MKPTLTRCMAMQERAAKRIPGMTQLLSKRPDMFSLGVWPGYYSKAQGTRIWDLDGNAYLDMSLGGIGATVLGFADPDVDAAVTEAIRAGASCSLNCPEEVELAERLCALHPFADMVRYARAGGEAMAMATRIVRAAAGRDRVAFCGYHGWHDWYLAANLEHDALQGHHLSGLDPLGVPRGLAGTALPFRYNHLEELEAILAAHGSEIAAVIMEPIRNEPPAPGFLEGVRRLADRHGAILVFDEISSGFRLANGGAYTTLSAVEPDVAVFAKAMGNGYPVAAVIGRREVMEAAQRTFISSTFWTDRVGPAAALATLRKFEAQRVHLHLIDIGERIQAGWRALAQKHGLDVEVGGIPPLAHFGFRSSRAQELKALFVQLLLDRGILASTTCYAMFAHTAEEVGTYLAATDEAFTAIAAADAAGTVDDALRGRPASVGFQRLN